MCILAKLFCQEKILLAGVTGARVRQFSVRDNGLAPCGLQQRLVISEKDLSVIQIMIVFRV